MTGTRKRNPRRIRVGACISLSGRFARFGIQAARGLEAWRRWDRAADLVVEDDRSDPDTLEVVIRQVASRCDVLLGPYSTQLMRAAGRISVESDWLLWNHGGSGDDVEAQHPGHVISVLTPTSRYAEPFLNRLAGDNERAQLWVVQGKGSFGRQVAEGAEKAARRLGINAVRIRAVDLPYVGPPARWDLFSAGTFEGDVETIRQVLNLARPPRLICTVAAGVRDFASTIENVRGIFGIGQWFPSDSRMVELGPTEQEFLTTYKSLTGGSPDYPAVQAAAGAVIATNCVRNAGGANRDLLWSAAAELDTTTLFGGFKINPANGAQIKHETVLVHWTREGLVAA